MARRPTNAVPGYLFHRARGVAYVNMNGKVIYLPGEYGSKESRAEYDRLIALWTLSGRQLPDQLAPAPTQPTAASILQAALPVLSGPVRTSLTVAELADAYLTYCESYYVKDGQQTTQVRIVRDALKILLHLFAATPVTEFGPLKLGVVCDAMIAKKWCRTTVIKHLGAIKAMFKWGTSKEMVPGETHHALQAFMTPRKDRSAARETDPVEAVPDDVVQATLPYLPPVIADMVQVQRLTGMRPTEVCMLRGADLKMNDDVWQFEPATHKNKHHGIKRLIAIGPHAQQIIRKYLKGDPSKFIFDPHDSEHVNEAGERYTQASYRRAVHRACVKAFPYPSHLAPKTITPVGRKKQPRPESPGEWWARLSKEQRVAVKDFRDEHRWSPNQLRHTLAEDIRNKFAIDASQVVLGHARPATTAIYASNNFKRAAEIMKAVG